jgi:hypothetical protein
MLCLCGRAVLCAEWDRQAALVCLRTGMAHRNGLPGRFHTAGQCRARVVAVTGADNMFVRRGVRPVSLCDERHVMRCFTNMQVPEIDTFNKRKG